MTTYDPPLDPGVNCERCGEPLVVLRTADEDERPNGPFSVDPMYGHVWIHRSGSVHCIIVNGARPNSYAKPSEAIGRALAARRQAEDDAADDAGFEAAALRKLTGQAAYVGMPDWQASDDDELIDRVIARRTARES